MWPYPEHWEMEEVPSHNLSSLMDLGEANYLRLQRLIPDLERLPEVSVSRSEGCLDLHLNIHDRWRYTTNLTLTYQFPGDPSTVTPQPNLTIRLYHDARTAEAMSALLQHNGGLNAQDPRFTLQHKWTLNHFLFKWLEYCLHRGHCFRGEHA